MKIPQEKQIAFLEKVTADTIKDPMRWNQYSADCIAALEVFRGISLDREGVFSYIFPRGMRGEFWLARSDDGMIMGALGTESSHMEWFDNKNEKVKVLLTRLFYRVFDRRPNANKLIDEYLNLEAPKDSE